MRVVCVTPKQLDSKKKSLVETIADITLGFLLFLPVNFFVLPLFVDQIASQDVLGMLTISLIYTTIALARKYTIRRWFESRRKTTFIRNETNE
jgi:hypothetical protein